MTAIRTDRCHICQGPTSEVYVRHRFLQVSSDCKPKSTTGLFAVCAACGVTQKPLTVDWVSRSEEIYAEYEIYGQGAGMEQLAFDQSTGVGTTRSRFLINWMNQSASFPETGKLLEIGCGNGSFLREFGTSLPGWSLTELELDDRHRGLVERLPNTRYRSGSINESDDRYDAVVLIHVLEHISDPLVLLAQIAERLNDGGLLLIEVPDLAESPFDILIADHCSHFLPRTLGHVVEAAGFKVIRMSEGQIPKGISLLAGLSHEHSVPKRPFTQTDADELAGLGRKILQRHLTWLDTVRAQAREFSGAVGIFGSSIAATWLASELGGGVNFFVDEDVDRVGYLHMGIPIVSVDDVPDNTPVLMPLRPDDAERVADRLNTDRKIQFVLPPRYSRTK